MGHFRQESCSELPFPPPGDLLDPRIHPASLKYPALAGGLFARSTTWEASFMSPLTDNLEPVHRF